MTYTRKKEKFTEIKYLGLLILKEVKMKMNIKEIVRIGKVIVIGKKLKMKNILKK